MSRARLLGASLLVLLAGCASSPPDGRAPVEARAAEAPAFTLNVAHRDGRAGLPSFGWITHRGDIPWTTAQDGARATVRALAPAMGITPAAAAALDDVVVHDDGRGPIVARSTMRVHGTEVFRAGLNILFTRELRPIALSGLVADVPVEAPRFVLGPEDAVRVALARMGQAEGPLAALGERDAYAHYRAAGLRVPARAKKVLFPGRGDDASPLTAGYYVEIQLASGGARSFVIDASSRGILFENDLVRNDAFRYRVFADAATLLPDDGPQGNDAAPHPTGRPDGYRPTWRAPSLVTLANFPFSKNDPWLAPSATTTSGNNVDAYADLASGNGFTEGKDVRPQLTSANAFDHTYDTTKPPLVSVSAAATQLFYVTNFLHDWFYDAGFDEKSGNHQLDNFGRGGAGSDELVAEAQDFSGRNNANAATPADGSSPRIQMFVFSGESNASLDVVGGSAAGRKRVGIAAFGIDSFDTTAPVVLANDAQGADMRDACESLGADVAGKIVLVHRGLCSFVQKIQNVQAAGGVGVLVANVPTSATPDQPPYMGGTADGITIPALSLALADGAALEASIAAGVTATMKRELQTDLDGALDTAIVAHEWGHVLSNRLVSNANGLTTNQAGGLGEGWGDFLSLLVLVRPNDIDFLAGKNWAGAYPTGAYATSGGGADFYFGIRRVPYSTDFTKNPLTFKHIENGVPLPADVAVSFGEDGSFNAEVHNAGEVWATMLWECYAALLRAHPFADAQERMKRYLVASLKLTPPDPTLLEARDAVLAAAFASDRDDFDAFWKAFARRGAGVGAQGPGKDSADNRGVVESMATGNGVEVSNLILLDDVISCDHDARLDEGELGTLTLTVRNTGSGTLTDPRVQLSSAQVPLLLPDGPELAVGPLAPFESRVVSVRVGVLRAAPETPMVIDAVVRDPSLGEGSFGRAKLETRFGVDEVAQTSSVDHVDTARTAWRTTGGRSNGGQPWTRIFDGQDGRWMVPDVAVPGQPSLVSPSFTIAATTLGLSFRHRHSFRFSTRRQTDIDGGVVEISLDEGATWEDASLYGPVDYNTTLDDSSRTDNPLKGRAAYGNASAGYPDVWVSSSLVLTFPAHPESVMVRFRAGTASGFSGAPGWEIDDIALSDTTSTPFWSFLPHGDFCDPKAPTVTASGGGTFPAGSLITMTGVGTGTGGPLTFAWSQASGPDVALDHPEDTTVSFVGPDDGVAAPLAFHFRAVENGLLSAPARVEVNVVPSSSIAQGLAAGGGGCSVATASNERGARGILGAALVALAGVVRELRRRRTRSALG